MQGSWQPPFSCTKRPKTDLAVSVEKGGNAVGVGRAVGEGVANTGGIEAEGVMVVGSTIGSGVCADLASG